MAASFAPVRRELTRIGVNPAAINALEEAFKLALAAGSDGATATDLTAILEAIAALTAEVVIVRRRAEQVELKIPPQLSREEILAITDNAILTEAGDYLVTEGGDRILLEA